MALLVRTAYSYFRSNFKTLEACPVSRRLHKYMPSLLALQVESTSVDLSITTRKPPSLKGFRSKTSILVQGLPEDATSCLLESAEFIIFNFFNKKNPFFKIPFLFLKLFPKYFITY
ncbi:hypothetical protein ES332_A09G026400v1 [Gossypium tomentosum]|uniref:Uncharacterized protein n=1 Tax=Gossypium tomentosum TaxID=34277 RepID=A0A5D2NXK9_GOSTO|nr:hypothetical protein ES332_A09G026400v1 [Gossypium tomentosum]